MVTITCTCQISSPKSHQGPSISLLSQDFSPRPFHGLCFLHTTICMLFSTDTVLLASPSRDHPGFPPISLYIVTHFGSVSHYLDLLTSFPSFMILLLLHDPSLISLLRISLPSLRFHKIYFILLIELCLLFVLYWFHTSLFILEHEILRARGSGLSLLSIPITFLKCLL